MTSQQMTADLLVGSLIRMTAEQPNLHPAFRAGLPSSPALDRAVAAIEATAGQMRARRIQSIKAGAAIIINEAWRLARLFPDATGDFDRDTRLIPRAMREIAGLRNAARSGRDFNAGRLRGLEQAVLALRVARRFGEAV